MRLVLMWAPDHRLRHIPMTAMAHTRQRIASTPYPRCAWRSDTAIHAHSAAAAGHCHWGRHANFLAQGVACVGGVLWEGVVYYEGVGGGEVAALEVAFPIVATLEEDGSGPDYYHGEEYYD